MGQFWSNMGPKMCPHNSGSSLAVFFLFYKMKVDNRSKLCYYFFAKIIIFLANGSFWAKFGSKNCFSIQINNCNLALSNTKLYFDKVISRKKKKGRAIVIPNGYPPCFNCYLTDLRTSLGHFITSQLHVQYCNLSVAQFLMQGSPGTLF